MASEGVPNGNTTLFKNKKYIRTSETLILGKFLLHSEIFFGRSCLLSGVIRFEKNKNDTIFWKKIPLLLYVYVFDF